VLEKEDITFKIASTFFFSRDSISAISASLNYIFRLEFNQF